MTAFLVARYAEDWSAARDCELMAGLNESRATRDIDAKRKRLALYLDAEETLAASLRKAPTGGGPATAHSYVRERINVNQASGRFTALETSVRLDAMVYSDHPDYKQGWEP